MEIRTNGKVERKFELRGKYGETMENVDEAPVSLTTQGFSNKEKYSLER